MDIDNLYQKAVQSADSGNTEYAIELFMQILVFQPDHAKARRKLHTTSLKRAKHFPAGQITILFKGGFLQIAAKINKMFKKYAKATVSAEKYLLIDPSNADMLLLLAESCALANYSESAVDTYKYVTELHADNTKALRALGRIYSEMKEVKKAMECWEKITKLAPSDSEANKRLRDLSALDMMDKSYASKEYRKSIKDDKNAEKLQVEDAYIRTSDDVDKALTFALEELEKNPEETRFLLKVSDLYRRKKMFDEAEEHINRAVKLNPTDPTVKMKLGDLSIYRFESKIKDLSESLKTNPSDSGKQELEKLKADLLNFKLEEYEKRVEAHPTDLNFRFTYGSLLFESKQYDLAVSEFQQSRRDPQFRSQSLAMLGRSFLAKEMADLAIKQFNEGLKGLEVMDDRRKDLLYYLADAYIQLGDEQKAVSLLQEVLEVDIRFKDVSQRVQELRKKLSKKSD